MSYLVLAPATRGARLDAAAARWDNILAQRPEMAPAVTLQRRLIGLIIDLTDTVAGSRLPRLSLPPRYLAAKLERGVPALAGEPVPIPVPLLRPTLLQLCAELAAGGAGEAADRIRTAIDAGELDAGSLLTASLTRDQTAIRTGAVHRGLAPDLLWLVAELAASPFVHALQQTLFTASAEPSALSAALGGWSHGYCPACGSWPALVEAAEGRRALRCSFCAGTWVLPPEVCVYCGKGGTSFATLAPPDGRTDRRVETCAACRGYLKAVDAVELSPFPLLAIADLDTMDLDVMAMERGFGRLAMKDFARATPSSR
jgi:FdhE protein